MQNYFCLSALKPATAPKLPELQKPTNKHLCGDDGALHARRSAPQNPLHLVFSPSFSLHNLIIIRTSLMVAPSSSTHHEAWKHRVCIAAASKSLQLQQAQPILNINLFSLLHSRYMFELSRRHTNVPDVFLGKLYDASENVIRECCSAKDVSACLDSKVIGRDTSVLHTINSLVIAHCLPVQLLHPLKPSTEAFSSPGCRNPLLLYHTATASGRRAAHLPGKCQPVLWTVQ